MASQNERHVIVGEDRSPYKSSMVVVVSSMRGKAQNGYMAFRGAQSASIPSKQPHSRPMALMQGVDSFSPLAPPLRTPKQPALSRRNSPGARVNERVSSMVDTRPSTPSHTCTCTSHARTWKFEEKEGDLDVATDLENRDLGPGGSCQRVDCTRNLRCVNRVRKEPVVLLGSRKQITERGRELRNFAHQEIGEHHPRRSS